jgi:RNA-directed DNA polymerase
LKAPIKDGETITKNKEGIPQGGVISPLLANIALNGMGKHLRKRMKNPPKITRYADDFVAIHKNKYVIERAKTEIKEFLETRNLKLNEEKTKITHTKKGFEFLGYRISTKRRKDSVKTIIQPSAKKINQHVTQVKSIMKRVGNAKEAIKELRPIITG